VHLRVESAYRIYFSYWAGLALCLVQLCYRKERTEVSSFGWLDWINQLDPPLWSLLHEIIYIYKSLYVVQINMSFPVHGMEGRRVYQLVLRITLPRPSMF
jgi:hypothetical protein